MLHFYGMGGCGAYFTPKERCTLRQNSPMNWILLFQRLSSEKPPEFCCGVQLCLLSMMRWSAYQSWSPIGQESDKIIGNHFDIWHSQLTEYIHINLCGFWLGGVHESLQIRMWSNTFRENLPVTPFIVIVICNDIVILAMSATQNCQSWFLCVTRGSNVV